MGCHYDDGRVNDRYHVDVGRVNPIGRLAGKGGYTRITDRFEMPRLPGGAPARAEQLQAPRFDLPRAASRRHPGKPRAREVNAMLKTGTRVEKGSRQALAVLLLLTIIVGSPTTGTRWGSKIT